jgi:transposase
MRKINKQQKQYITSGEEKQEKFGINYELKIAEDDSVRLLNAITEELDYTELCASCSHIGRKPETEPKILFKVLVYAYMEFIYSTRKIEKACRRDINFMRLLQGESVPDHSTISRFRRKQLGAAAEGLFYQYVKKLCELGEVAYEEVFADGTKLEASANRYTFVWKKAAEKNAAKMLMKVQELSAEVNKTHGKEIPVTKETLNEDMRKMRAFLEEKKQEDEIEFVSGSGKRKSVIQKQVEVLDSYQERQQGYDESSAMFAGRSSYSKTDKDATFMRMKDDHMRNGQLKPAYNVQLAVEAEFVVGVGVFSDCNDTGTLKLMLENMYRRNIDMKIKRFVGDAGYESEENYMYLESKGIEYYIKPQNYEQQKKRSFKRSIGRRENMTYNAETDEYTCHNGKQLKPVSTHKRKSESGYAAEVTVCGCESCEGCPHKEKCTKAKGSRRMEVSKTFLEKRQKSYENITSETGVLLRINRSIQVEGAFGVLKEDRQFDRFFTRGKPNVTTELLLLCFGYNVNKLHAKIQAERTGKSLHQPKAA